MPFHGESDHAAFSKLLPTVDVLPRGIQGVHRCAVWISCSLHDFKTIAQALSCRHARDRLFSPGPEAVGRMAAGGIVGKYWPPMS